MRKWIKRILMALGGLALILFLAVYFGGRLAAQKYLARNLTVGEGKVRLVSPRFLWSLDLSADSALYDSPALRAVAGRTVVSANLFKSLFRFSPSVTLDVDTLWVRVSPEPDTVKPKKDSIPFPEFRLPASIQVRAGRVTVFDTAADSLGPMVRADGLDLESLGPQAVRLAIRDARVRQTGELAHAIEVSADWADSQQVTAKLSWKSGEDDISLSAQSQKANLLRAATELRAHVASTAPYYKILKLSGNPPIAEGFDANFRAEMDGTFRLEGNLTARVHGFSDSAPFKLGPQKVAVKIDFKDSAGSWSATSRGERGEDVVLKGNFFTTATARDSITDPAWLAGHLGVTAHGHAHGIMVDAAGKRMRADLEVTELKASGESVRARISTGDGSRITADLRKAPAAPDKNRKGNVQTTPSAIPDWNGTFSADIAPGERWMVAFTDTNIVFGKARIAGKVRNGEVSAVMDLYALKAYGVLADSARLNHRYSKTGYELQPSRLYRRGTAWELAGKVDLSRPGGAMQARFGNPRFGKVEAAMPRPGVMELHARDLALEQVPYKGMDSLKANQPRVTADFVWDKNKRTGSADVQVDGRFKGETLKAKARADWDPERLVIKETRASMAGSEISASAKVFLRGRQFYELAKLAKEDFEEVSLSSDRFDIAKALSVAMPEPPLKTGVAMGRFSYRTDTGFDGAYKFQNIRLAPTGEVEKISLKELAVIGKGDTLLIKLVTVSESEPLFNDSATLALTGVLAKEQGLIIRARLGNKVFLDFQGRIQDFNRLTGRLGIRGDAVLPQASGELRDVKVRAN
ncbi:MAG: hypothetical protein M3Y08_11145, partial [Fibrobacterota bacterium]|nr:hypothetical protein [Fibrobacterota bacterium]